MRGNPEYPIIYVAAQHFLTGTFMYLVVIAWMYVALMMGVAEANHPNGTLLGAVFTVLLYGVAPVALLIYLMGRPARRAARQKREAAAAIAAAPSDPPDGGGEAPADPVAPVRKEP
ncbi:hypothetical protein GCM10028813_47220 [Ramlibacter alkalitolerans]